MKSFKAMTKHLFCSIGLFRGEDFRLFNLIICECHGDPVDSVTIFGVQVGRFLFSFGWKNW